MKKNFIILLCCLFLSACCGPKATSKSKIEKHHEISDTIKDRNLVEPEEEKKAIHQEN